MSGPIVIPAVAALLRSLQDETLAELTLLGQHAGELAVLSARCAAGEQLDHWDYLLLLYLALGDVEAVAALCREQGVQARGDSGPRDFTGADIAEVIAWPATATDGALRALAQRRRGAQLLEAAAGP